MTITREDLLDCLRKLEQERHTCWEEARKHDISSTTAHSYYGMVDGFDFALGEITARFGIELEQVL